jgi:fibronectin-binding autotransporter adhesin
MVTTSIYRANGRARSRRNFHRIVLPLATVMVTGICVPRAARADLTWDSSGSNPSAPVDGSGTWNTSSPNWSDGATDHAWNNANNDNAVFGGASGTPGTVTLGTDITAGGLTFNKNYTINGTNTLTLSGSPTIHINAAATINCPIAGTGTVKVTNWNFLTLTSPSNNFTGKWNISDYSDGNNGPVVQVTTDSFFGAVPGSYTPDAITLNGGQIVSGSSGTPNLTINANRGITNDYYGAYFQAGWGGTLEVDSPIVDKGGWSSISTVKIRTDSGIVYFANSASTYTAATQIGSIGGYQTTAVLQVAKLSDGGVASSIGASDNSPGNLVFGGFSASGFSVLNYTGTGDSTNRLYTIASNAVFNNNGTGALNFTNSGAIVVNAGASYSLSFGGTYAGAGNTISNQLVDPSSGGTLALYTYNQWTLTNPTNSYSGGTHIGSGTLTVDTDGELGAAAGSITFNNSSLSFAAPMSSARSIDLGTTGGHFDTNGNDVTLSGSITDTGYLQKWTAGTLHLTNPSNSYSGATFINEGVLNVASLADGGMPSSIGVSTSDPGNLNFGNGTLQYTGATPQSTNRLFNADNAFGTSATIDASGSTSAATVSFTNTGAIGFFNVAAHTLTLTGTNTGTNTFAPLIGDQSAPNPTTLIKSSSGSWTLSNSNTYTGDTDVNGGTLIIAQGGSIASGHVAVAAGATLLANGALSASPSLDAEGGVTFGVGTGPGIASRTLASLTVGPTGVVTVADPGIAQHAKRTVLVTGGLSISGGGTLDLTGNDLIVHGGNLPTITSELANGFSSNGYWNGSGITSSAARTDGTFLTTLGVIQNVASDNVSAAYSTFDGVSGLTTADVLVKYTYYGDADLSGSVNGQDYNLIDAHNGPTSGATWGEGDFNYDGKVDGSDYSLIDNAFNQQGSGGLASSLSIVATNTSEVAGPSTSAVPEPGSLSLLGMSALALLRRRRK